MKTLVFLILMISTNFALENKQNYWDILPYPIDHSLGLDERVELKEQKKNGISYVREITVHGQTKYWVSITKEAGFSVPSRSSKVWVEKSKFNLAKDIDKYEPRKILEAYENLLNEVKKKEKSRLEPYELYTLVYEVGIHDKTVEHINNLAYYYAKKNPKSALLVRIYNDILMNYPERTVTYYNLADAYWALGNKKKALREYGTYISEMRKAKKEHKGF